MKYIALLAIFATALAAPAPENQVVMDTPATHNERDGSSPHVEVNVYLNGEAPVSSTSSAFRCYYCGNQATNDLRTTAVCKTAGGKVKPCGSKEDGVGCTDSKFTKAQFARECGIVGCISSVETCSASSKPKDQEEVPVSDTNEGRRCYHCGSQTLDDLRTTAVCGKSSGDTRLCGSKGPMSCVSSKLNDEEFGKECGMIGCISATKSCPSSKSDDQKETSMFDEPVEVNIYVNEL